MKVITKSKEETYNLGKKIAENLQGGEVVLLEGELGAGKTTFTRGIINYFLPKKRVLSPTFIIVRHYPVEHKLIKNIYHLDFYRISKNSQNYHLDFENIFNDKNNIVIIEWPKKIRLYLAEKRIDIFLKLLSENRRLIRVKP